LTDHFFFANKFERGPEAGAFINIYPHPRTVMLCCSRDEPIYQVKIREVRKGEISQYWGWFDNEDEEYSMIWPSKIQMKMCFPYGPEAEESRGAGRQVNLVVEEVGVWRKEGV